jgi:hypothetical protein
MPMPENDTGRLIVCCCFSMSAFVTRRIRLGKPAVSAVIAPAIEDR